MTEEGWQSITVILYLAHVKQSSAYVSVSSVRSFWPVDAGVIVCCGMVVDVLAMKTCLSWRRCMHGHEGSESTMRGVNSRIERPRRTLILRCQGNSLRNDEVRNICNAHLPSTEHRRQPSHQHQAPSDSSSCSSAHSPPHQAEQ